MNVIVAILANYSCNQFPTLLKEYKLNEFDIYCFFYNI
jgi:hypothetical protein